MKKIEIINVQTPEIPKEHKNLIIDNNDIYSERQNVEIVSLDGYFDEGSKMLKINKDYKKALEKLETILHKYYFLKLFSKSADKSKDFNIKMMSMDKYINQLKKYFLDIKKVKNAHSKKNIVTDNDLKELFYKVNDFLDIEKDIEKDLYKFESENYPKIKMTSYNQCKDKSYQELEKISEEINGAISSYKSIQDAYDYICYNSGNLIIETVESIIKKIKENPDKSKMKFETSFFFEEEVIIFLDFLGWIDLFNKIHFVKQKCDPSIFEDDEVKENLSRLEKSYLVVLIYNEATSRRSE